MYAIWSFIKRDWIRENPHDIYPRSNYPIKVYEKKSRCYKCIANDMGHVIYKTTPKLNRTLYKIVCLGDKQYLNGVKRKLINES